MRKYPLLVEWDLDPKSVNIEVTPSLLAQSMFFYVQAVGHFYANGNYYTDREQYHSFLLLLTKTGSGQLHYRGKGYKLSPNSIFLIDCKERHVYQTGTPGQWETVWLHFNGGTSQSYFELISKNAGGPIHELNEDSPLPSLFDQLLQAHGRRSIHTDILSSKWILEILTELLLQSIHRHSEEHTALFPPYILEIMNEMERNCSKKITLDDLAEYHNFNKYHLAREFKKYTGYSPNEYLTNVRLSLAKDMLKYSRLSIGQIAEHAGYNQTSFFIKTFKQREGMTPLDFRKSWRQP
ncbi:AraC family transcriptional regulator [Paenibacillus sedimenti]|uniref:AraC family transcriptional regulator n=1 Tax=Paenibacillus sedimenti TaxID=2770274 RepID=A0A926KMG9_9BACL|nr:AraC family transcriptional regulator [Paenibacillus sedimenti]MBD0380002.1 AraC family transcriptional regulator [Paenibacillus sedimenti]